MGGGILKIGRCLRFTPLCRSISDSTATAGSGLIVSAIIRNNPHCRGYPPPYNHVFKKIIKGFDHSPTASSRFSTSFSVSNLGVVKWYLRMVKARPVLTKSVTASLIYTAADLSSQLITSPSSEQCFDFARTVRMAGYGMLILGPSLHLWFNFVSRVFPKRDVKSTLKKILMAQTLYGPAMTSIFLSLNAGFKGENASEIMARLRRDLVPTMINDICLFTTLFRFDLVYNVLFKCVKKKLLEYPNLYGYMKDIYQIPKVAETCNFQAIMDGYYKTLFPLNPGSICPISPSGSQHEELCKPHGRECLSAAEQ